MFGTVIDNQNCKVAFVILDNNKQPLYYELKEDESIIEIDWQVANSMNKPQWNGSEWIDTDPLPPQQEPEPTPTVDDKIIVLENENAELKAELAELRSRTNATEDAVLELMMMK